MDPPKDGGTFLMWGAPKYAGVLRASVTAPVGSSKRRRGGEAREAGAEA